MFLFELIMDQTDELLQFRWRLAETIAWCSARVDISGPAGSLRTPELQPRFLRTTDRPLDGRWRWEAVAGNSAAKVELALARERLLRQAGEYPSSPADDLAGGKLLLFYPGDSVLDAFSGMESDGFFDEDDGPPWDTWVWISSEDSWPPTISGYRFPQYIVTWVPGQFLDLANWGAKVNATACISWRVQWDYTPLLKGLKTLGWLD